MTDKELLINAVETHVLGIGTKFFNMGIAGELAARVVIRNLVDKYGDYVDLFITKDGSLVGDDALFNAACEMLDNMPQKGYVIWKVKLTSDDVRTIQDAFKHSKAKQ